MTAATSVSTEFLWYSALSLIQDHIPWFSLVFGLGTSPAHSAITIAPYTSFFLLPETAAVPVFLLVVQFSILGLLFVHLLFSFL